MAEYTSKYPEIVTDREMNSPNNPPVSITVEQLYDLYHHTHKLSDLLGASDIDDPDGSIIATVSSLKNDVDNLVKSVNESNDKIEEITKQLEEAKIYMVEI